MAEVSLQLSTIHCFNITNKVPYVLDLVDFEVDVDALVSSCIEATDVECSSHIVVIALNELEFVVFLRVWTLGRQLKGFSGATGVTA